ncbi:beta-propeller domain-containing protein [Paenibacillus chungangensis]|uniref:Beta-propeller domain-containing protein n=1 Tax=Paenibacillus chungangensis TaxID=696535 RepID=A0ABW3HTH9_9BACL
MKKKGMLAVALAILLSIIPLLASPPQQSEAAQRPIQIQVNGAELALSEPAFIEDGITLAPARDIAEALGAEVTFEESINGGTKQVRLIRGDREAILTIGSTVMTARDTSIRLEAAPRLVNGVTMVPLRAITESFGSIVAWDNATRTIFIDEPLQLPTIGSVDKLQELIQQSVALEYKTRISVTGEFESVAAAESADITTEATPGDDYSTTNVQVAGVDEGDWAKTDGNFIYQISGRNVYISSISDEEKPQLAATLRYDSEDGFTPVALYVDGNTLIVLGESHTFVPYPLADSNNDNQSTPAATDVAPSPEVSLPPPMGDSRSTVKTLQYELDDNGRPTLKRELFQEGSYLSSRKVDSALYVITNKYAHYYRTFDTMVVQPEANVNKKRSQEPTDMEELALSFQPVYGDTAITKAAQTIPLDQIRYFPNPVEQSMLLVGAVNLDDTDTGMQISSYLGAGESIYASKRNLYVAQSRHEFNGEAYVQQTQFHKFRLDQGGVVYIGEGTVPGALLNQFSMDEHRGFFRAAITNGNMWATGEAQSTNNLYVLDERMKPVGKLEGLAPGERIYSARFMGDRAYMVTFRNVDPLFAIDLTQPDNPTLLGKLKIPGYSDYLHPYDENHLIGFGKDTIEVPSKGMSPDETVAYYQGMKIALFDITDVNNPKEKFKEIIGDRGTHSDLLNDHKALLFSRQKGLMAFPVELHELQSKDEAAAGGFPAYGDFTYQGAYIYSVDLDSGFQLQGRITHMTDDDYKKSGQYGYDYRKKVKRILYSGDTLYTLSESQVKASTMSELDDRGSVIYPAPSLSKPTIKGNIKLSPITVEPEVVESETVVPRNR